MRLLLLSLGIICAGAGLAGVALPGLPSTPFFILAAYFFARSSPRLLGWVEGLPRVGKLVKDFRAGLGLPLRTKRSALAAMALLIGASCVFGGLGPLLSALVVFFGLIGAWVVWYGVPTQSFAPAVEGADFYSCAGEKTRAILLVNLGSPDSTDPQDVKRYLDEFLMDARVIDYPWIIRALLVRGIIIRFRLQHAVQAYRSIWTAEGSPLIGLSEKLTKDLQKLEKLPVGLGMRYQNPSIEAGIRALHARCAGLREILVVPLYPQFAMSTTETVIAASQAAAAVVDTKLQLRFLPPFYRDPLYIEALTAVTREELPEEYDHLLFSFHSLPERHIRRSDRTGAHCLRTADCCTTPSAAHEYCYRHQCVVSAQLVADALGLPPEKFSIAFQSRLRGAGKWLGPDTESTLARLAANGKTRVAVLCPAFVTDCLETLDEIHIHARDHFLRAGGREFKCISCLNHHPLWVAALQKMCASAFSAGGWLSCKIA